MLVSEKRNNIQRFGGQKEKNFNIKASRKAFEILSSQIYTDNKLAIVREISVNAVDSHIAAGKKNVPISVHLPNLLEPFFSVRDYGLGLSPEDVETIYTTYFESTKTNSNDYTGCLGIGSKTPFSYVDNFFVTSYWNGKQYSYSAFIGQDGFPQIALMGTAETEECNGLEVKLPIKREDFITFASNAKKVYSHFEVFPSISGEKIEPLTQEVLIEGTGWKIVTDPNSQNYYNQRQWAVMGNVRYKIDPSKVAINPNNINRAVYYFHFDIGELDIAASREELFYSNKTNLALMNKFEKLKAESNKIIKEKIESCKDFFEACIFYENYQQFFYGKLHNIKYKGRQLDYSVTIDVNNVRDNKIILKSASSNYSSRKSGYTLRIKPTNSILRRSVDYFVINDLNRGIDTKLRVWCKDNGKLDRSSNNIIIINSNDKKILDEIFSKVGIDDYKNSKYVKFASTFLKFKMPPRQTTLDGRNKYTVYKLNTSIFTVDKSQVDVTTLNDCYYIKHSAWNNIKDYLREVRNFDFDMSNMDVYILPDKTVDNILAKAPSNFFSFEKEVNNFLSNKMKTDAQFNQVLITTHIGSGYLPLIIKTLSDFQESKYLFPKELDELRKVGNYIKLQHRSIKSIMMLMRNNNLIDQKDIDNQKNKIDNVYKKWPLFKMIGNIGGSHIDDVYHYIMNAEKMNG